MLIILKCWTIPCCASSVLYVLLVELDPIETMLYFVTPLWLFITIRHPFAYIVLHGSRIARSVRILCARLLAVFHTLVTLIHEFRSFLPYKYEIVSLLKGTVSHSPDHDVPHFIARGHGVHSLRNLPLVVVIIVSRVPCYTSSLLVVVVSLSLRCSCPTDPSFASKR